MTTSLNHTMTQAARLTREGHLAEATALIQRALGGRGDRPTSDPAPDPGSEPGWRAWLRDLPGTLQSPGSSPTSPSSLPAGLPDLDLSRLCPSSHREWPGGGSMGTGLPGTPQAHDQGMSRHTSRGPAGERPYLLHVPERLPAGPVPLLVMLHGGTQDGAAFAAATGMNALADERGFLVAYPEQVTSANAMRYWNWFSPADQRRGQGEAAILAGIVEEIAATHAIDPGRVFVAGFSAGAAMAAVLGDQYPDVFAAVGVHSGLASGSARDVVSAFAAMRRAPASRPARQPVRTIVFHGSDDRTVDVSNARAVAEQFCSRSAEATTDEGRDKKAFTKTVIGAGSGPDCEVWIVQGAGHVWSGGRPGGSYADPHAPDASAAMVRFFLSAHPGAEAQAA